MTVNGCTLGVFMQGSQMVHTFHCLCLLVDCGVPRRTLLSCLYRDSRLPMDYHRSGKQREYLRAGATASCDDSGSSLPNSA
jgi:hypothetical protein